MSEPQVLMFYSILLCSISKERRRRTLPEVGKGFSHFNQHRRALTEGLSTLIKKRCREKPCASTDVNGERGACQKPLVCFIMGLGACCCRCLLAACLLKCSLTGCYCASCFSSGFLLLRVLLFWLLADFC